MARVWIGGGLLLLAAIVGLQSQTPPVTRTVKLFWTASISSDVLGYNVRRCTEPCVFSMADAPIAFVYSTTAIDSTAIVDKTYLYGVTAVAPPCPSTLPGGPCGESVPATASIKIDPKPAAVGALGWSII